jgi:putative Mn2+ efflux pump MntP
MSFWSVLLLALAVSADAFAVALGKGLHMRALRWGQALAIALTFAMFQTAMPLLGWLLGSRLAEVIRDVDHWVAFGLLVLVGGHMIWVALTAKGDDERDFDRIGVTQLLVLGLATSIDALAVGISLAFVDVAILGAAALFGLTTLALSLVGVVVGHRAGLRFRGPAEIIGGLVLIAIGLRILLEHLGVWG